MVKPSARAQSVHLCQVHIDAFNRDGLRFVERDHVRMTQLRQHLCLLLPHEVGGAAQLYLDHSGRDVLSSCQQVQPIRLDNALSVEYYIECGMIHETKY